jgi:hypothetical protein
VVDSRLVRAALRRRELARLWRAKPLTFNEKVRYKMLADRRPMLTTFADKLAVRTYVESKVGEGHLTELYAATSDPRSLTADALPREFVVKPTHASGAVVIVADFAPPGASLRRSDDVWTKSVVRPESLDWNLLQETGAMWLSHRYFHESSEWAYRGVPAMLMAEELLEDGDGVPPDYKLCVFDGRVKVIEIHLDRFVAHTKCMYTTDWERIPANWGHPAGRDVDPPAALPEMIEIAERLGEGVDFVRVDMYAMPDRIVCGELTNYPLAGTGWFDPPEFDRQLGELWTLPRRYPRS